MSTEDSHGDAAVVDRQDIGESSVALTQTMALQVAQSR